MMLKKTDYVASSRDEDGFITRKGGVDRTIDPKSCRVNVVQSRDEFNKLVNRIFPFNRKSGANSSLLLASKAASKRWTQMSMTCAYPRVWWYSDSHMGMLQKYIKAFLPQSFVVIRERTVARPAQAM